MKNSTYMDLRRTAAKVYQKRTEELARLNAVPEAKRQDGHNYRVSWMKDALQQCHRGKAIRSEDKKDVVRPQGFLSGLHELVTRRDPGFIIESMSCIRRGE